MKAYEYLRPEQEPMPRWLAEFQPGDKLDFKEIFSSRLAYYPGAGDDGQCVRSFNMAHFAHVFLYVDYLISEETARRRVIPDGAFNGYRLLETRSVTEQELTPEGYTFHVPPHPNAGRFRHREPSYCLLSVFERFPELDDSHGAERFAFIQLCADGIATYDAVFGNGYAHIDGMVLQDHGFGCNYDRFGRSGYMERIARVTGIYPKYIFCEHPQVIWDGYRLVEDTEYEKGGMWGNHRYLYIRDKTAHSYW